MTNPSTDVPIGRPREFEPSVVLRAALDVFWRQGYAATSLDDLTSAMGLSRSSFYGAFGSKHAVLLLAMRSYVDEKFADLEALAAVRDPARALRAVLAALAKPGHVDQGCLLVNAICELAPDDAELRALAGQHIARIQGLIERLLAAIGHAPGKATKLAGALLACAIGITMLRKAGLPDRTVASFLRQAEALFEDPG